MRRILVLVLALAMFVINQSSTSRATPLSERSRAELSPYLWGTKNLTDITASRAKGVRDSSDPLIVGMESLSALHEMGENAIVYAKERIDEALKARDPNGVWRHPAYSNFPEGWWTGMDFGSIGLASLALYQKTGEQKYLDAALGLFDQMVKPPSEHGTMWKLPSGACWLSEYTWETQKLEQESYVLNGALLALQSLRYITDLYPDRFRSAYDCARDGIAEKRAEFVYPDNTWNYYMLNAKTENQGHYMIYEMVQLHALHLLTGDQLFLEMLEQRRRIIQKGFTSYRVNDHIFLSRVGPPHPYIIDVYTLLVSVKDSSGNEIQHHRVGEGLFLFAPLAKRATTVAVRSASGHDSILLYEAPIKTISPSTALSLGLGEPDLDLTRTPEGFLIDPLRKSDEANPQSYVNDRARVVYKFQESLERDDIFLFGIEFQQERAETAIIDLKGENGASAFRTLPKYDVGRKQLMLLSLEGFRDVSALEGRISGAVVGIDTLPEQAARSYEIGDFLVFRNSYELYDYLERNGRSVTPIEP